MKYSIGEFAVVTGLSPKTLRYYDEVGILKPTGVNPANGYRHYDESGLVRAEKVLVWKEVGFSLDEIRALLDSGEEKETTLGAIERQIATLGTRSTRISAAQERLREIADDLRGHSLPEPSREKLPGGFYLTTIEEGGRSQVGEAAGRLYTAAANLGYGPAGPHEAEFDTGGCTPMGVQLPVSGVAKNTRPGLVLAAEKVFLGWAPPSSVAYIDHSGPLITLPTTYQKLTEWFGEEGLSLPKRYRERYSRSSRGLAVRVYVVLDREVGRE